MDRIDYKKVFADSLEDFIQLLRIPSVYDEKTVSEMMPYGQGVYDALQFMKQLALKDGFEVLEYENHAIAIRYTSGFRRIDVVSHLDVVEPGNGWLYDPFAAEIVDGKLYARGSQDMKTCAWLTYLSLKLLKERYPDTDCEVRIVLGCDEERTMNDMRYYVDKAGKPDFAFTPDGAFPMGIGEKGALMWRLHGHYSGAVKQLDGGVQCNVIAPMASAVVDLEYASVICEYIENHNVLAEVEENKSQLIVKVYGKAAHASRPEDGHNAIVDLLCLLGDCLQDTWCQMMAKCFIDPYGSGCDCACMIEPMGRLTMNLGVLKVHEGVVYGEVDARYPYGITSQELTSHLQGVCPCKVSLDYDDIPTLCSMDDPYVQALLHAYQEITNDMSEPVISGGVSYSKVFEHCVAFGPSSDGDEKLAHQANEYVLLDVCPKYLEIYYNAIFALMNVR